MLGQLIAVKLRISLDRLPGGRTGESRHRFTVCNANVCNVRCVCQHTLTIPLNRAEPVQRAAGTLLPSCLIAYTRGAIGARERGGRTHWRNRENGRERKGRARRERSEQKRELLPRLLLYRPSVALESRARSLLRSQRSPNRLFYSRLPVRSFVSVI